MLSNVQCCGSLNVSYLLEASNSSSVQCCVIDGSLNVSLSYTLKVSDSSFVQCCVTDRSLNVSLSLLFIEGL